MTRLIDASELIQVMCVNMDSGEFDKATHCVDVMPTVDAVPVIRCKDCKYWLPHSQFGFDEDNEEFYDYCELLVPDDDYYAITRQAEDYCSRAERKEHETG